MVVVGLRVIEVCCLYEPPDLKDDMSLRFDGRKTVRRGRVGPPWDTPRYADAKVSF